MAVSIYQLGYKKLSRIIFEWQAADRASLMALFILMEAYLHWLWCLYVWIRRDKLSIYVDMDMLYPMWLGVHIMGLFAWWMVEHLSRIKDDDARLNRWQIVLISVYSVYIAFVILVMGQSGLVSGVSLVGGAMLGMMLIRRRYIWRAFLGLILLVLVVISLPYWGIDFPSLQHIHESTIPLDIYSYLIASGLSTIEMSAIENAMATSTLSNEALGIDGLNEVRQSSALFWHSTHIYLAVPKAIFIVYVFRALLLILDASKAETLKHANQDELTQLTNRRYGLTQMQDTLAALDHKQNYSVILMDLDWFKSINDSYGHQVGDQVLQEVAGVLKATLKDTDNVSRYGGEEFLIVLPSTAHHEVLTIAEQLRSNIAEHMIQVSDGFSFQVTASFGVYTLTCEELARIKQDHMTTEAETVVPVLTKLQKLKRRKNPQGQVAGNLREQSQSELPSDICQRLISIADKALYEAKDRGRNKVVSANEMRAAKNRSESSSSASGTEPL
ncbi:GGDEF domain-containing protein [Psychrobacter fulvigenes]|uniref:GGDEF domain-containing protein n=1 Tax=Psychrobacter fulvigenes TaxID=533323 RepID=UPI00191939AE|nr:GGDEF domain-containing protein [Psychrobacter fulvigenes]